MPELLFSSTVGPSQMNTGRMLWRMPRGQATITSPVHLWTQRRVASGPPWPDLLLVDGGRGQLAAVQDGLVKAGAGELFELASIAKAGRRAGELDDVIFRPGRKNPMAIKSGSAELLFLQRVRDTTHDFVIGRQRLVHRGNVMTSRLESLEGRGTQNSRITVGTV